MANDPQVPWTDEQWARVGQVIQEEARRARVAATFLPLYGPLPPDTDFVRRNIISYPKRTPTPPTRRIAIGDRETLQLATLQVKVPVRNAQLADPEMTSVLALFRRAANVLARLEDAVVFRGLVANSNPPPESEFIPNGGFGGLQPIWEIHGGQAAPGLWGPPPPAAWPWDPSFPDPAGWQWIRVWPTDEGLVRAVSDAIGRLESHGHFGPFAVVLGQGLFLIAQTPTPSLVLPQDRIIPFLGGGSLLRSATLDECKGYSGVVVALGGTPVEIVIASDVSFQFLQVTEHPNFIFRVYEKIALRIKEFDAIVRLYVDAPAAGLAATKVLVPTVTRIVPVRGPTAGGRPGAPSVVAITGTNFQFVTQVEFDGSPTTNFKFDSNTQLTVTLPPRDAAGKVHVTATSLSGSSEKTDKSEFTYQGAGESG